MSTPTAVGLFAPGLSALLRPLDELRPDPKNARAHDERNLAAIRESLARFGQQKPVVVAPDGIVLAGNGTLAAARALGWSHLAAVTTQLTDEQARAYALADNRSAELASWDPTALLAELQALPPGMIGALGWEDSELRAIAFEAALAAGDPEKDPNAAPPLPETPRTKPGDLFLLGRHRLLCGDSTVATDVERLLGGAKPQLMVTDPPYGVEYDPEWRKDSGLVKRGAFGKVSNDDRADWREAWALFPGQVAYVWHGGLHAALVAESVKAAGFEVRAQIVWVKPRAVISRGAYHWQHEPALVAQRPDAALDAEDVVHELAAYAVRKGSTALWAGGRRQSTVWHIEHPKSATGHGTQKPVEAMARPIRNHGKPGDGVYDPFVGSGTTVVACEILKRDCFAMELDPAYCDVVIKRWEDFTGLTAVLQPRPV